MVAHADIVILPGTKQTVNDLCWMREQGLDAAIQQYARTGLVVGICGGMQMLGETIADPLGMEIEGSVPGLGLLPIRTIMQADKVTRNVTGSIVSKNLFGMPVVAGWVSGYEIHVGRTIYQKGSSQFAVLSGEVGSSCERNDGCISTDTRVFGTYLHGLFDNDSFRHQFLRAARAFHGLAAPGELHLWKQLREESLDRLAREVEKAMDMKKVFRWVGLPYRETNASRKNPDLSQVAGVVR
jgi:adenosylcobyric acid synthase